MVIAKRLLALAAFALLLAGCGGGGGSSGGTIPVQPPNPSVNQAPVINSISPQGTGADPIRIQVSSRQHIVVGASDPDNDALAYTWAVDNGYVAGSGAEADFTAPADPCNAIVTVEVNDGHGHAASARCCLLVYKPDTPQPPPPTKNEPPVVASITANPDKVEVDGTSAITVIASDPEGDPLTYTYVASGGGIESCDGNSATWRAPSVAGGCSVSVSVSDGHNPAVAASVAIAVGGPIQPPVTYGLNAQYIQNGHDVAHPRLADGTIVFTRVDRDINFDWGRKAPDPLLITLPESGNGHDFGVIWTGYIKCETPGLYVFRARYDDGLRLWISDDSGNMQTVIDGWSTGPAVLEGSITLQGHKWYKLLAHYYEDEDRSYVQLYWMPSGNTTWSVVPADAFRTE